MSTSNSNRSTCGVCGGSGGQFLRCFSCPQASHINCLQNTKKSRSKIWACDSCSNVQLKAPYEINNLDKYWYKYLRMFDTGSLDIDNNNSTNYQSVPSIGMLLLSVEWIVSREQLPALATFISEYFGKNRSFVGAGIEDMTSLFTQSPMGVKDFNSFTKQLSGFVDKLLFNELVEKLKKNKDASAIGLASSSHLFSIQCSSCSCCRYLRSFCFNCGHVFDVYLELENSFEYIIEGNDSLTRLETDMQLEYSMIGFNSLEEKNMRGKIVSDIMPSNGNVFSTPAIIPLVKEPTNEEATREEVVRLHSENRTKRNANYYDAAFRGLSACGLLCACV
jgi:hypothetical protein